MPSEWCGVSGVHVCCHTVIVCGVINQPIYAPSSAVPHFPGSTLLVCISRKLQLVDKTTRDGHALLLERSMCNAHDVQFHKLHYWYTLYYYVCYVCSLYCRPILVYKLLAAENNAWEGKTALAQNLREQQSDKVLCADLVGTC